MELKRTVAIKILRSTIIEQGQTQSKFEREAHALARLRHPFIVSVYDLGHTPENDPFLVMEHLEGRSLALILSEGRDRDGVDLAGDAAWLAETLGNETLDLPSYLRCVVGWAADLASALHASHSAGVFHRDVKPSNILVCRDGRPVLLDFGIAAQVDQETITRDGSALGTPAYMAPETLGAKHVPNGSLDIYGLAATLYHICLLYTSPSPRDRTRSRMPSSA